MTSIVAFTTASLLLTTSPVARPLSVQGSAGRTPSFAYTEASGCDGLFLYAWNEARSEVLTIRVDRRVVNLADGTTTINLATAGEGVAVQVELTDRPRGTMPYCSEAGQATDDRPSVWVANAGIVKLVVRKRANMLFTPMSVTVDNLVLTSPEGTVTRSKRTVRFTAAISELAP